VQNSSLLPGRAEGSWKQACRGDAWWSVTIRFERQFHGRGHRLLPSRRERAGAQELLPNFKHFKHFSFSRINRHIKNASRRKVIRLREFR
jgi:hypothetical protein